MGRCIQHPPPYLSPLSIVAFATESGESYVFERISRVTHSENNDPPTL